MYIQVFPVTHTHTCTSDSVYIYMYIYIRWWWWLWRRHVYMWWYTMLVIHLLSAMVCISMEMEVLGSWVDKAAEIWWTCHENVPSPFCLALPGVLEVFPFDDLGCFGPKIRRIILLFRLIISCFLAMTCFVGYILTIGYVSLVAGPFLHSCWITSSCYVFLVWDLHHLLVVPLQWFSPHILIWPNQTSC